MLQACAVGPSACVQLSGSQGRRGAARSLPSPSLTCLRVWELLWLEQPPPPPASPVLSSSLLSRPQPASQALIESPFSTKHWLVGWLARQLQVRLSKVASEKKPPVFFPPFHNMSRRPRAIWGIFRKAPGAFNLQAEVIGGPLQRPRDTMFTWKVDTSQWPTPNDGKGDKFMWSQLSLWHKRRRSRQ